MSNISLAVPFLDRDFLVRQGFAFHGADNNAALATNFSHVQLFNPVGSIVTVLVDFINVLTPVAQQLVRLQEYNTALEFTLRAGLNKNVGGAAPVAQLRIEQTLGFLGTEVGRVGTDVIGYRSLDIISPILLGAGEGVLLVPTLVNTALNVGWGWRERLS